MIIALFGCIVSLTKNETLLTFIVKCLYIFLEEFQNTEFTISLLTFFDGLVGSFMSGLHERFFFFLFSLAVKQGIFPFLLLFLKESLCTLGPFLLFFADRGIFVVNATERCSSFYWAPLCSQTA